MTDVPAYLPPPKFISEDPGISDKIDKLIEKVKDSTSPETTTIYQHLKQQLIPFLRLIERNVSYNPNPPFLQIRELSLKYLGSHPIYPVFIVLSIFLFWTTRWILKKTIVTITDLVSIVYPAIKTLQSLEKRLKSKDSESKEDLDEIIQWNSYWILFGFIKLSDHLKSITSWIPFFKTIKFLFIIWLMHPNTAGARKIFHSFLLPLSRKKLDGLSPSWKNLFSPRPPRSGNSVENQNNMSANKTIDGQKQSKKGEKYLPSNSDSYQNQLTFTSTRVLNSMDAHEDKNILESKDHLNQKSIYFLEDIDVKLVDSNEFEIDIHSSATQKELNNLPSFTVRQVFPHFQADYSPRQIKYSPRKKDNIEISKTDISERQEGLLQLVSSASTTPRKFSTLKSNVGIISPDNAFYKNYSPSPKKNQFFPVSPRRGVIGLCQTRGPHGSIMELLPDFEKLRNEFEDLE